MTADYGMIARAFARNDFHQGGAKGWWGVVAPITVFDEAAPLCPTPPLCNFGSFQAERGFSPLDMFQNKYCKQQSIWMYNDGHYAFWTFRVFYILISRHLFLCNKINILYIINNKVMGGAWSLLVIPSKFDIFLHYKYNSNNRILNSSCLSVAFN